MSLRKWHGISLLQHWYRILTYMINDECLNWHIFSTRSTPFSLLSFDIFLIQFVLRFDIGMNLLPYVIFILFLHILKENCYLLSLTMLYRINYNGCNSLYELQLLYKCSNSEHDTTATTLSMTQLLQILYKWCKSSHDTIVVTPLQVFQLWAWHSCCISKHDTTVATLNPSLVVETPRQSLPTHQSTLQ